MLVILFLIGKGMLKEITNKSAVIGKKQKAESQLKKNIAILPQLSQNYQNLGDTKDLIAAALPSTPGFPELAAPLESIATTSNVALNAVTPQDGLSGSTSAATAGAATSQTL